MPIFCLSVVSSVKSRTEGGLSLLCLFPEILSMVYDCLIYNIMMRIKSVLTGNNLVHTSSVCKAETKALPGRAACLRMPGSPATCSSRSPPGEWSSPAAEVSVFSWNCIFSPYSIYMRTKAHFFLSKFYSISFLNLNRFARFQV